MERKSSSANVAARGINLYCWNGIAAPQVAFCRGEIPLASLVFKLGIFGMCGCFFFLYCRRLTA